MPENQALTAIILVNYNGYRDTINCLNSLSELKNRPYFVVVVDNKSPNNSVDHLLTHLNTLSEINIKSPNLKTKLRYKESNGREESGSSIEQAESGDVYFIESQRNGGFAAGCNLGIKLALRMNQCEYFWLLNNDTEVDPLALDELITVAGDPDKCTATGSTLLYWSDRETIQAAGGGILNTWTGVTQHVMSNKKRDSLLSKGDIKWASDYIVGASMLVTKKFIEVAGLMDEAYFLYYEELDWIETARGRDRSLRLCYAVNSLVYHKEGASAGTNNGGDLSMRRIASSRYKFMKKFFPRRIFTVRLQYFASGLKQLALLRPKRAVAHFQLSLHQSKG